MRNKNIIEANTLGGRVDKEEIKKGFLNGEPEGGMHAHTIDRNNKQTLADGAHLHLFILPSGEIVLTKEDGKHPHTLDEIDSGFSSTESSGHSHTLLLSDESQMQTESGGEHIHQNMVETTGFDGAHSHDLVFDNGTRIRSLSAGDFIQLFGAGSLELPESPPASGYTKVISRAIHEAMLLRGEIEKKEVVEKKEVSNSQLLAIAALGFKLKTTGQAPGYTPTKKQKKKKKKKKAISGPKYGSVQREWNQKGLEKSELLSRITILKQDKKKQIVYGVVLEPDTVDAHDDVISKAEVAKAAHFYMTNSRVIGLGHTDVAKGAVVVESYIAQEDFEMGGQLVSEGSWVMGVHISDPNQWQHVERGVLNSFSVGGWALRVPE